MNNHSRPGASDPRGKRDRELKTNVSEATEEAIIALAHATGVSKAEYLRNVIEIHVHGASEQLRLASSNMFGTATIRREDDD